MGVACIQAGCVHTSSCRPQTHAGHRESRVSFRKFALAFFHIPLYQLPDGYSRTYREHLVQRELSPVVLGERKSSNEVKLASGTQPPEDESDLDTATDKEPADDSG